MSCVGRNIVKAVQELSIFNRADRKKTIFFTVLFPTSFLIAVCFKVPSTGPPIPVYERNENRNIFVQYRSLTVDDFSNLSLVREVISQLVIHIDQWQPECYNLGEHFLVVLF